MLIDRKNIAAACDKLRAEHKKIVFTNGCFDILHAGHVRYLNAARALGDILIVGLNSDSSVRTLKGADRPINPEPDRAEILSGLRAVDHVVVFNERTAESVIAEVKPDIYVKGGDYDLTTLPEAKIVQSYGGRVEFIPLVKGRSTTNIVNRMRANRNN